ncbi:HAD-like domain-containing protein [Mycena alexandri]|uniref:HAD-like domain-containing protein n=1 Tax=Mycena alexandri TaxID=1745969 RepID=A0AAD6T7Z5_9AGAR|nr:HAD-like domain-containing protein [Mycena alexandri]
MDDPPPHYLAVISPSAHHSVAYLNSTLATAAAAHLQCGQYLAVILELPNPRDDSRVLAHFVQSTHQPLPTTYIPIFPCRVGTREPLTVDFEWPFGECVIDTSRKLVFQPVPVESNVEVRKALSADVSRVFRAICRADDKRRWELESSEQSATRKAEQAAAGIVCESDSGWTTFSLKSTVAQTQVGQFFPPLDISVQISYDIECLREILPATQCLDDVENVKRLRARFSRLGTERTILWTMHQVARATGETPCKQDITDFEHSPLFEFSTTFERPLTPDADTPPTPPEWADEDDDDLNDWFGWVHGIPTYGLPPPPLFEPQALQIIYLDVYGTLIDHHSGIFDALGPLLARSPYCFDRHEALSFYFEVEDEMKQRTPASPYSEILRQTHQEMAVKLGLSSLMEESSVFASSAIHWPLFDGALQSLQTLRFSGLTLIAVTDMDFETFSQTSAYQPLAPYFSELWCWDLVHTYRPPLSAMGHALVFHDNMGVPRERRCLVSDALFQCLDLACQLSLPAVWVRNPAGLAGNPPDSDASFVWKTVPDLPALVSAIVAERVGAPQVKDN